MPDNTLTHKLGQRIAGAAYCAKSYLQRETKEIRLTTWLWLSLAFLTLVASLWMFRYDAIADGPSLMLWDRWDHRTCVAGVSVRDGQPVCTREELYSRR